MNARQMHIQNRPDIQSPPKMNKDGPLVLLLGIPSSGNHMMQSFLMYAGAWVFQRHFELQHSGEHRDSVERTLIEMWSGPRGKMMPKVIIVSRQYDSWRRSFYARWPIGRAGNWNEEEYRRYSLDKYEYAVEHYHLDVMRVQYEDIVAEPDVWAHRICKFVGVEPIDWPFEVYDGNAKYRS